MEERYNTTVTIDGVEHQRYSNLAMQHLLYKSIQTDTFVNEIKSTDLVLLEELFAQFIEDTIIDKKFDSKLFGRRRRNKYVLDILTRESQEPDALFEMQLVFKNPLFNRFNRVIKIFTLKL